MLNFLNYIINIFLPYVPKGIVKIFANKYIAGISTKDAIKTIRRINNFNLKATADILGEHTTSINESKDITSEYIKLIKEISKNKLDCNISLKLSHIGYEVNKEIMDSNIEKIHNTAIDHKNFIRLDMEDNKTTDNNIKTYLKENKKSNNIGIVFQAYLKRTFNDINKLSKNSNIRLCKGIYIESEKIAYKKNDDINNNFMKLLELAFNKKIFVGIATHDEILIDRCIQLIKKMNISSSQFEFQALYGVPINPIIKKLKKKNFNLRIYVPFGKDWYKYSIRRLKENPNVTKYIIENIFKSSIYK
tara:strand:- start:5369 stop:6280 length:912 start_codon:yes stop_codon:yes gene_type:complete